MTHTLAVLLLALCCIIGLVLVPLGLPGLWVMVGGVLGYGALTGFRTIGIATLATVLGLALLGELLEWWVGFGLTERYGGPPPSRRGGPPRRGARLPGGGARPRGGEGVRAP